MSVEGPLDWEIKKLFGLAERNTIQFKDLNPEDRSAYDEALEALTEFAYRIGFFAVPDGNVVTEVWGNFFKAIPGYFDSLSERETIWTVLSRFSLIQRIRRRPPAGPESKNKEWISPSGYLFVELRRRLNKSKWAATKRDQNNFEILGSKFGSLLFRKEFPPKPCDLDSLTDRQKRDMKVCGAGCDILLLRELGFKESLVAALFGEEAQSYPYRQCPGRWPTSDSTPATATAKDRNLSAK